MTFTEAVGRCFVKSFSWEGRASRREFWYFHLFVFIVAFLVGMFTAPESPEPLYPESPYQALFLLAVLFPLVSVLVRRLHDQGRSGWWAWLALFVPFAWIVLGVLPGTPGANFYGPGEGGARPLVPRKPPGPWA